MIRNLLAFAASLRPRRCADCGQRVPAPAQDRHDRLEHAGDRL
jgi:hypothetical protein